MYSEATAAHPYSQRANLSLGADLADGDVLRLQRLHRVEADPCDVIVASGFGAELLDYVFRRKSGVV